MVHAQYDWTTGVPDNGNEGRKFRAVPRPYPLHSLVCTLFTKGGSRGLLDYQGRAGIISIVRWNLRPVIFVYIHTYIHTFGVEVRPRPNTAVARV